jgi:hypothetical protein
MNARHRWGPQQDSDGSRADGLLGETREMAPVRASLVSLEYGCHYLHEHEVSVQVFPRAERDPHHGTISEHWYAFGNIGK